MKYSYIILGVIFLLVGGSILFIATQDITPLQFVNQWLYDRTLSRLMPSLDRAIVNRDPLLADVASQIIKATEDIVSKLRNDWKDFDSWIQLGLNLKMLEDYEGARLAWEFAAKLQPEHPLPFHNLGSLYGYELGDISRAETNFKQAIVNGKHEIYIYYAFYEFYRDIKKDPAAARQVLDDALVNNPLQADTLRAAINAL